MQSPSPIWLELHPALWNQHLARSTIKAAAVKHGINTDLEG